jgi:universal stress protein E
MQPFTSILVDIDASVTAHPALERAVRLARSCGAKLTIVDVMTIPADARLYMQPDLEEEIVSRRRKQLTHVAQTVTGVPIDSRLLVGRPATVLIQDVLRYGHDLVVRSHARDLVARGPKPFGVVDMELLRKCPCPVLVAGPGGQPEHPRVVGAVHANAEDPAEQALNVKILELTLLLARLEQVPPTVLQAWAPFAEQIARSHYPDDEFSAYVESARRRAADDLAHLIGTFGDRLSGAQVELLKGEPQDVIPEFVVAHGIDLVVMGTVARTGIAGLLSGNTAERMLRNLPCSVLAVKPDGFVSPVSLD